MAVDSRILVQEGIFGLDEEGLPRLEPEIRGIETTAAAQQLGVVV